jgi:hypothetical protein
MVWVYLDWSILGCSFAWILSPEIVIKEAWFLILERGPLIPPVMNMLPLGRVIATE